MKSEDEKTANNAYFLMLDLTGAEKKSKSYGSSGAETFNSICFTADDTCVYGRFLHLVSLSALKHHPPNTLRMA